MDWLRCPAVEQIQGKVSGVPVIKGSRVRPQDLVVNRSEGEAWLADAYDLPLATVRQVLGFYRKHMGELAGPL